MTIWMKEQLRKYYDFLKCSLRFGEHWRTLLCSAVILIL